MKIIGLTGGIGTGKSTVSDYLREKGCHVIDADELSRKMTEKGAPALKKSAEEFGEKYISEDGNLERKALGDLVFSDASSLSRLQSIITERVIQEIDSEIQALRKEGGTDIVVIDAPLLFECGMESVADENWLVTADMHARIERIKRRDGLSQKQIENRINNQMTEEKKRGMSQYILDNSGTVESLYRQIDRRLERVRDEI